MALRALALVAVAALGGCVSTLSVCPQDATTYTAHVFGLSVAPYAAALGVSETRVTVVPDGQSVRVTDAATGGLHTWKKEPNP